MAFISQETAGNKTKNIKNNGKDSESRYVGGETSNLAGEVD